MRLPNRPVRQRPWRVALGAAWLACALPVAAQMPALPAGPPSAIPPDVLARAVALATEAASALNPPGLLQPRVVAQPGALDPRLTLAPCARIEPYLPAGVPAWGHTRVGLRCTDGRARWNVYLPVTVQVWASGVVALVALPAGARLIDSQLGKAEIDWAASNAPAYGQADLAVGRTLIHPLAVGQPLLATDLQPRQWFALGDTVRIVASGAGYAITTDGEALGPGLEGQPVRVRTEGGRVLVGRPVSDHCLEVSL